jgi:hypothetical protein
MFLLGPTVLPPVTGFPAVVAFVCRVLAAPARPMSGELAVVAVRACFDFVPLIQAFRDLLGPAVFWFETRLILALAVFLFTLLMQFPLILYSSWSRPIKVSALIHRLGSGSLGSFALLF